MPFLGSRILRIFQQIILKRFKFCGYIIVQHTRNQTGNRIHHDHGRQFSACEHIISDRNIICHNFLQNTFIDSFIVPAEQHQFFFFCQFFCHSLGKSRSLWRKIHDTRLLFHFFCDRLICLINRFCLHQHTCSASIWIIIHALMFVKRVIPDIDRLNGKQPVVYRSSDDTGTQSLHDHVRK